MLQKGYPIRQIQRELPALTHISYPMLASYVQRFLVEKEAAFRTRSRKRLPDAGDSPVNGPGDHPSNSTEPVATCDPRHRVRMPKRKPVFEHDPDSAKRRDDLI